MSCMDVTVLKHPTKSRKYMLPSNIENTNLLDGISVKYLSGFNDGSDKEFMLPRDTSDILEDEEHIMKRVTLAA
ncbi:hypothetical protein TNCT_36211 [Trichonephila clavata]|uniref:Uncharacterized protein n=1 Tax=Trichonephila clavata TaxID=2740835 RepID=A0A8X6I0P0_TRICU|nr:hypothetical protein TNCT_36211 [Trichonephila clavata]